jgi:ATP-dependent DNA helicase RecG
MRESTDGFVIAEKDLQLRGPGEVLGTRQTGLMQFRVADLVRDADLLPSVQEAAIMMQQRYPERCPALIDRWLAHGQQFAQV